MKPKRTSSLWFCSSCVVVVDVVSKNEPLAVSCDVCGKEMEKTTKTPRIKIERTTNLD